VVVQQRLGGAAQSFDGEQLVLAVDGVRGERGQADSYILGAAGST
jgi:hypothetical protein